MDTPSNPPSDTNSNPPFVPPTARATPESETRLPAPTGPLETPLAADEPPPPQTVGGWIAQNGIYLAILAAIVGYLLYDKGWQGLLSGFLILFGLSFVVFIHEMGHFLTAKWFDVHVMTFSIGFGPAIPGCSFKRGETTYKLSVIPLGGYVRMVGEGSEAEEEENYPRSFKNKPVGQRMIIISAGVIMNVILGAACLTLVYGVAGVDEPPGVVAEVDAGSPAWDAGVQSGMKVKSMNGKEDPTFAYLKRKVSLSNPGKPMPFEMEEYPSKRIVKMEISPRNDHSPMPVIGIVPPRRLELAAAALKGEVQRPVHPRSAAAAARAFDLAKGETIFETTDPETPDKLKPLVKPVSAGASVEAWQELGRRMRQLEGKPFKIKTNRGERALADGFDFDDVIVGTTSAARQKVAEYDPLDVEELPLDPRATEPNWRDPFVFKQRLRELAGRPVVIQVRRGGFDGAVVNVLVPPAYYLVLPGVRMEMGQVAAVRNGPARSAGVQPREGDKAGDEITAVVMKEGAETLFAVKQEDLDPVRLPRQLRQAAASRPGKPKTVELTVKRFDPKSHEKQPQTLKLDWDEDWSNAIEVPFGMASPTSIPELGLAYWVKSTVAAPATAADTALRAKDVIIEFRFKAEKKKREGWVVEWSDWQNLKVERGSEKEAYDTWAHVFYALQNLSEREVEFKIRRSGEEQTVALTLQEDTTWADPDPGLILMPDRVKIKADSLVDAVKMGVVGTGEWIQDMYLGLLGMVTGRLSGKLAGGPLQILDTGYKLASVDYFKLILFLGIISINLAVVNFLPIPLLDGGHMVFLIYEKIRGKPASEQVQAIAAYTGLAILGLAMAAVFVLDIVRMTVGL